MSFDRDGFYREIGLRAQILRKRAELTQERVATELSMPRASYANVERGRQRVPVDVIWRLAFLLNVPVQALLPVPNRESKASPPSVGDGGTANFTAPLVTAGETG